MPKTYQLGEPCENCGTPTVQGPKGIYCKPCYIKYAEEKKKNWSQPNYKSDYTPEQAKSQEIRGFQESKEESMKLMSCGRDAVLLTIAEMAQGNAWTEEDIQKRIEIWKGYLSTKIYVDKPAF